VTVTATFAARPGGESARIVCASTKRAGARDVPSVTCAFVAKPLPWIVIHVPPDIGPTAGGTDVIVIAQVVLQAPLQHDEVPPHAFAHAPQFALSLVVSTHALPHVVFGAQLD
jgi:hypothetical protein